MRFLPGAAPERVEDLGRYTEGELERVGDVLQSLELTDVYLAKRASEPVRPRDGMLVYADGANWNPGSGPGVYYFNGSTWSFLG